MHPGTRPRARQSHDCAAHADYIFPTLSSVPASNQGHARDARGGTSPRLGHRSAIEGPPTPAAIHRLVSKPIIKGPSTSTSVGRGAPCLVHPRGGTTVLCLVVPGTPSQTTTSTPARRQTRDHTHTHTLSLAPPPASSNEQRDPRDAPRALPCHSCRPRPAPTAPTAPTAFPVPPLDTATSTSPSPID